MIKERRIFSKSITTMDLQSFIIGALGGGSLGMILQHFLNKDRERQLFNNNFKKELYFKRQEKALELLGLIDVIKNNIVLHGIRDDFFDKDCRELEKFLKNKGMILNLTLGYFPSLKGSISEYTIAVENFIQINVLCRKFYMERDILQEEPQKQKHNENLENTMENSLKCLNEILDQLKISISSYLIEEAKIT